jgi:predicted ATP-dependent serine protease
MADAPWRCSQCGTVNEPVANACRTCGRWPSLFELEGSTIDVEQRPEQAPPELYEPTFEPEPVQTQTFEHEAYEADVPVEVEEHDVAVEDDQRPKPLWQRLSSLIIPIGIVLYIVISAIVNNDPG